MAGSLYLGSNKVCPAIVVKQGSPYIPAYSIDGNGALQKPVYKLTGGEFDGLKSLDRTSIIGTICTYNSGISGDLVFKDLESFTRGAKELFSSTNIETASFDKLANGASFNSCFFYCANLKKVYFKKIDDVYSLAFMLCFCECPRLEDIYFNSLKTTSFRSNDCFEDMIGCYDMEHISVHTIHFPSNLEATIQQLSGYPTFGGNEDEVVLAFDLPPTE